MSINSIVHHWLTHWRTIFLRIWKKLMNFCINLVIWCLNFSLLNPEFTATSELIFLVESFIIVNHFRTLMLSFVIFVISVQGLCIWHIKILNCSTFRCRKQFMFSFEIQLESINSKFNLKPPTSLFKATKSSVRNYN